MGERLTDMTWTGLKASSVRLGHTRCCRYGMLYTTRCRYAIGSLSCSLPMSNAEQEQEQARACACERERLEVRA